MTSPDDAWVGIECSTFTHARRHPKVLGKVGGWTLPVQLSVAQLVVLFLGYLMLAITQPLWGIFGGLNTFILVGVPAVAAWAVRRARVEGRDVLRWLAGHAAFLATPKRGVRRGRPIREPLRIRPTSTTWVEDVAMDDEAA